jgi:protein involved in polysaccharide export with SLBB domain/ribosomal protein L12E/L44/L45/RPP1/RPP2
MFSIFSKIVLLTGLLFQATILMAQIPTVSPEIVRSELQKRGLKEEDVRAKLQQRGIDIDNVTADQLPTLQPVIEEVIKEIEAAKKATSPAPAPAAGAPITPAAGTPTTPAPAKVIPGQTQIPQVTVEDASKIREKIKDGVSIEEALSETANTDKKNPLPPAQIYGQHLFRDKSLAVFRTTNEVKPPDTYILSTGDIITISVFGVSQFDSQFEINKDGFIQPSGMPKMFLKGISLGQSKELLRNRFKQYYRFAPEQFAVSLTTARTINVNIFGETNSYGSFTLSAINTAFNALVAAGGPSDIGTVRTIKVIRGKQTKVLDVYAFMNNPSIQFDFFLEDNDMIYVPVSERVVNISGAIRRPFKFELITGENLVQLLQYAGGLNPNAYNEVIQVRRFINDKQVLIDVNLKVLINAKQDFSLLNGDEVIVRDIPTEIENTANITGAVELPGGYALTETPRVSDLLKKGVLQRGARTDMAFLLRKNPNGTTRLMQLNLDQILAQPGNTADILLERQDELTVYTQAQYIDLTTISVIGAVRTPIKEYPFSPDSTITLQRAVLLSGGLRPDANGQGYIIRTDPNNAKKKEYIPVNITEALQKPKSKSNLSLQPFDELDVFSSITYTDASEVNVVGAVRTPGKFQYSPTLTLKDLLLLAGGMKMEAATNRIDVYRVQFNNNEPTRTLALSVEIDRNLNIAGGGSGFVIMPFDEIVVRSVPEFEFQQFVDLNGEVKYPGRYALVSDNETLSGLIKRAGGLTTEADEFATTLYRTEKGKGYVVTRLNEALRQPRSTEDHVLKAGDVLNVPKREDLVTIKGLNTELSQILRAKIAANNQINVAFTSGKRAGWYIKEYAGGFTKDAYRRKVTVEQPNGKINRTKRVLFFKIYPKVAKGSIVFIPSKPEKPEKEKKEGKNVDWDKKLSQILAFMSVVTTAIVAYATISKL